MWFDNQMFAFHKKRLPYFTKTVDNLLIATLETANKLWIEFLLTISSEE